MIKNKTCFSSAEYDFKFAVAVYIDKVFVEVQSFEIATRVIQFRLAGYFLEYAPRWSFILNEKDNFGFPVMIYVGSGKLHVPVGTGGKFVAMEHKGNFFEDGKPVLVQASVQISDETRTGAGV